MVTKNKKRLKLASIRDNENSPCPFGLPISFGCKCAGEHIRKMAPVDIMGDGSSIDEEEAVGKANTRLLAWNLLNSTEKPTKCLYAEKIMDSQEDHNTVACNYDDSAPGSTSQSLVAPPFYSKIFNGGLNGLYTYPVGYYSDYNVSRNMYYGNYSLMGRFIEFIQKVGKR